MVRVEEGDQNLAKRVRLGNFSHKLLDFVVRESSENPLPLLVSVLSQLPRNHAHEDEPQRPHVRGWRHLREGQLRRQVWAKPKSLVVVPFLVGRPRQPEVANLDGAPLFVSEEEVVWLDVAMDDVVLVEHLQAKGKLKRNPTCVIGADDSLLGDELGEVAPSAEVEHQAQALLGFEKLLNLQQIVALWNLRQGNYKKKTSEGTEE